MSKIENSLDSIRLWVAKRRHDGLTDGLGKEIKKWRFCGAEERQHAGILELL
jgi:hypothetical protein